MTNTDLTGLDTIIDPTDDDLVDVDDSDESSTWIDDEDDFSYSAVDDRWNDSGVPSWSAWA